MSDIVDFWRQHDEMEARLSRPLSERMLDVAQVSPGVRVLDVACGRGEPSIPAAHRVGPHGRVLAIDHEPGVLQMARERAAREGLTNIQFQVADAETLDLAGERFDVATVRWALMYMRRPELALESIHRALKPGGTLVLASWGEADFALLPREVLSRFCDVPPIDASAPGVSRHADASVLEGMLQRCGFEVQNSGELHVPIVEAPNAEGILSWIRQLGGVVVKRLEKLPESQQQAWEDEMTAELERHRIGERVVLGGITRLTVARCR